MRRLLSLFSTSVLPTFLGAQSPPPVRLLGPLMVESREIFGSINAIRVMSDGRVLVNDAQKHRLLLLDTNLSLVSVVADSTFGGTSAHGRSAGTLIPFTADSTLYVDLTALSFLVIDPAGKIIRVMAAPRPSDLNLLAVFPFARVDKQGRLIYRGPQPPTIRRSASGDLIMADPADSTPIYRVDLASRRLDTVASIKVANAKLNWSPSEDGRTMHVAVEANPLPFRDEWTLMTDGTIALIRGHDFHVDWVGADGAHSSSPRIPFEWQRLSDDDKAALIDSLKQVIAARPPAADVGGLVSTVVPPTDLPDYRPAFFVNVVIPTIDNKLWIATTTKAAAMPGSTVYDVIDRGGTLVERVALPASQHIRGFGPDGAVFLVWQDGLGTHLGRARHSPPL